MKKIKKDIFDIILLTICSVILIFALIAYNKAHAADYVACFTPEGNCTNLLINETKKAKSQILVNAYYFTAKPIAKALINAHKRGIDVRVILDKSQQKSKYSQANYLVHYKIPVYIDYKPAIAHNKFMVIDQCTVQTGSFNYTNAAQYRNAENMLLIRSCMAGADYIDYWHRRFKESRKY